MTYIDRSNTVLRRLIVAFLRKCSSFLTCIIDMLEMKKKSSTMNLLGFVFEILDHPFFCSFWFYVLFCFSS